MYEVCEWGIYSTFKLIIYIFFKCKCAFIFITYQYTNYKKSAAPVSVSLPINGAEEGGRELGRGAASVEVKGLYERFPGRVWFCWS